MNMKKTFIMGLVFSCGLMAKCAGVCMDATTAIVNLCNTSKWCMVVNVDDTGFDREIYTNEVFKSCVQSISNNWQSITNEWSSIRDDFEKKVVFRNMAGFAGTNAFYGIMDFIVNDAATNAVSRGVVVDSLMAPRTPLWMFTADHYDIPAISNLLEKVIQVFSNEPEERDHYRSVLSGEYKRHLDDMREDGAIEY